MSDDFYSLDPQVASVIPANLRLGRHLSVRMLHGENRVGRVTAMFQLHEPFGTVSQNRRVYGDRASLRPALPGSWGISYALAGTATLNWRGEKSRVTPGTLFQIYDLPQDDSTPLERAVRPEGRFYECTFFFDGWTASAPPSVK